MTPAQPGPAPDESEDQDIATDRDSSTPTTGFRCATHEP